MLTTPTSSIVPDTIADGCALTSNAISPNGRQPLAAVLMMYSRSGNKPRGVVVQARDRRLLEELAVMRITDREQAKIVAGFGSTTRVNARLLALTRAGLLQRFFLGTNFAGRKAIYSLSRKGAKFL